MNKSSISDTTSPSHLSDASEQGGSLRPRIHKRKLGAAGREGREGLTSRSVKRRASQACACCRARKVRCNVTEYGAPCTNCRLDEVDCVVSESRRKKLVRFFFFLPLFCLKGSL